MMICCQMCCIQHRHFDKIIKSVFGHDKAHDQIPTFNTQRNDDDHLFIKQYHRRSATYSQTVGQAINLMNKSFLDGFRAQPRLRPLTNKHLSTQTIVLAQVMFYKMAFVNANDKKHFAVLTHGAQITWTMVAQTIFIHSND